MFRIVKRLLRLLLLLSIFIAVPNIYLAPFYSEYGGHNCLRDARKYGTHTDYVKGLRWVPWAPTVFCGVPPMVQDFGNQDYNNIGPNGRKSPKPIPPGGTLQLSHVWAKTKLWPVFIPYFAVTSVGHYHFRIGLRVDDNDNFSVFSIALKKIPYDWEKLLLNWERPPC